MSKMNFARKNGMENKIDTYCIVKHKLAIIPTKFAKFLDVKKAVSPSIPLNCEISYLFIINKRVKF